ncbi:MAG: NAD(P)H-hydrate dehydratase [Pseudomonadota bacterium]
MITLPIDIYSADGVKALDRSAIDEFGIPGYTLMRRAGAAALSVMNQRYPGLQSMLVLCGGGNNGGDGYVVARLARAAGLAVRVVAFSDPSGLKGDAALAYEEFTASGGSLRPWDPSLIGATGMVVDALIGSGLKEDVRPDYAEAINALNQAGTPITSLDIPSGLDGDTGIVRGTAVRANLTVTFVGLNSGLFMAEGPLHCGRLVFADLELPDEVYRRVTPVLRRQYRDEVGRHLPPRTLNSHKGQFGHVLCVGGAEGMPGAVRLSAEAALRGGAGLVTVATAPSHAASIVAARPELMTQGVDAGDALDALLERATIVVCGPGLDTGDWGRSLLSRCVASGKPMVLDADALNIASEDAGFWQMLKAPCIITPHPGEAARLIDSTPADVQSDRLAALSALQSMTGAVTVLKGAGTLVGVDGDVPSLCPFGNPGMSAPGMGDVLAGLIGALFAQGLDAASAARIGVLVHALAGDSAARRGERGLLAGELLPELRHWLNPRNSR